MSEYGYEREKENKTNGHLNKLFKNIKKRKLKNHGCVESSLKKVKINGTNISNKDCNANVENKISCDKTSKEDIRSDTVSNKNAISEEFIIIGGHSFSGTNKVTPVLPKWLLQPELIPSDLLSKLSLGFPKFHIVLKSNLQENNINQLFPVQRTVIPWILHEHYKANLPGSRYHPRDLCVSSPTGSGKTLTYVLPIVQCLLNRVIPRIRCLVVVPVQELAEQVANVFRSYVKGTKLIVEVTTGGKVPLKVEQERLLKKSSGINGPYERYESLVDIVVTTPGRLVEHLQKTEGFNLRYLKYLVIDEADRMMENIQNDWLFYLDNHLGQEEYPHASVDFLQNRRTVFQKLLFSATLSHDPEKLRQLRLFQPILFTAADKKADKTSPDVAAGKENTTEYVGKFMMPKELEEFYIIIDSFLKPVVIAELLSVYKWRMILCFCKSASEANRLSKLITILCPDIKVRDISSMLHRTSRNLVLNQFINGEIDILVSSDVMARGIDIPKVRYVISYDPPKYLRGYVHRAGRTGRAGAQGTVLTLTTPAQLVAFTQKLQEASRSNVNEMKIDPQVFKKWTKDFKMALRKLNSTTKDPKKNILNKKKRRKDEKKMN